MPPFSAEASLSRSPQLAAHALTLDIYMVITAPMFGLADATSARVGAHLGRGAPKAAARAAGSALRLMLAASVVLSAALIALREQLGPLFSHDPKASAHVTTRNVHTR